MLIWHLQLLSGLLQQGHPDLQATELGMRHHHGQGHLTPCPLRGLGWHLHTEAEGSQVAGSCPPEQSWSPCTHCTELSQSWAAAGPSLLPHMGDARLKRLKHPAGSSQQLSTLGDPSWEPITCLAFTPIPVCLSVCLGYWLCCCVK